MREVVIRLISMINKIDLYKNSKERIYVEFYQVR